MQKDIEKLILLKGLIYGFTSNDKITISDFAKKVGTDSDYDPKNLETSTLPKYRFFSDGESVALSVHPIGINFASHSHDFCEINYMYKGSCKQVVNNETTVFLETGDLIILEKGVVHSIELPEDGEDILLNFMISKEYIDQELLSQNSDNLLLQKLVTSFSDGGKSQSYLFKSDNLVGMKEYFERCLDEYYNSQVYSKNIIHSYLSIIFSELSRIQILTQEPTITDKQLQTCLDIVFYMKNNFARINLKSTAEYFHFSPNYLSNLIKKNIGESFTKLLHDIRLKNAYRLLSTTDYTIDAVSELVGYKNVYYFTKIFKQKYDFLPSEVRKKS